MRAENRDFLVEFIKLYKSKTELWKSTCPAYKNRKVKNEAYTELVRKWREMQPDADKDFVARKINSMRTVFTRERRKVRLSNRLARCEEEMYVPTLWYYNHLKFLTEGQESDSDNEKEKETETEDQHHVQEHELDQDQDQDDEEYDVDRNQGQDQEDEPSVLVEIEKRITDINDPATNQSPQSKKFWKDFLILYRSQPALWQKENKSIRNATARKRSFALMVQKLREYQKKATVEHVKKRINSMRGIFRREFNKVQTIRGYVPTLWYYKHLEFLIEPKGYVQDIKIEDSISSIDDQEVDFKEARYCYAESANTSGAPNAEVHESSHVSVFNAANEDMNNVALNNEYNGAIANASTSQTFNQMPNQSYAVTDEAKTLSASWELLYRKLLPDQKIYVQRVISEALYLGALDRLTADTYKSLEQHVSQQKQMEQNPIIASVQSMSLPRNDQRRHVETHTTIERMDEKAFEAEREEMP